MRVTFLGTDPKSGGTGCPSVFATDRGTYLVQGKIVTDDEAVTELGRHGNGIPADETVVEIPTSLAQFFSEGQ